MIKSLLSGKTIYMRLLSIKGLNAIRPGLDCLISMIISVASRCGFQPLGFRSTYLWIPPWQLQQQYILHIL